ncbi:MAG: 4Fe-4S binding protein [Bacteroidales bacterium]|nr:4Fe-4S binding protein [Bacteroidales bacterium]
MLFNVLQREFIVFGQVFSPQDFHLFFLAMLVFIVFIVLFTVIYGRVWCGWACPQTVFLEMVFRRIEYWIEGDANRQKMRDNATPSFDRLWRKVANACCLYCHCIVHWQPFYGLYGRLRQRV